MDSYLLSAIFFSIPLLPRLTTFLIIGWAIVCILSFKKDTWRTFPERKTLLLSISLYIWILIGLTYTMNLEAGLLKIQTQFSFLLFPLLLGKKKIGPETREKYFKYFIWGVALATLICFANALYRYNALGSAYMVDEFSRKVNIFTYKEFSKILDLHPAYFSLYLGTALFYILHKYNKWGKPLVMLKALSFILLFTITLFLTSSKAGIYLFTILLVGFVLYWLIKGGKRKVILLLGTLVSIGAIIAYLISPLPFKRLVYAWSSVQQVSSEKHTVNESTSIRLDLWRLSFEVAKESPIIGYGTGSVQNALNERCIDFRFFSECELLRNKNSHNQYLNFLLSNGMVFLLIFAIMLGGWLVRAIRVKDEMAVFFLLMLSLNFLFESLLQRERGVVFFMLFATMLLVSQKEGSLGKSKRLDGIKRN